MTPRQYVYSQNTIPSFEYVDFWPKIYLILYPSFGDLTTHVTIMLKEASFGDANESAKMNVMSQTQIEIKSNENKGLNLEVSEINEQAIPHKMTHNI